jgi:flavin reductase (DIM6/NTAB) family NADH-FMN oxidoreductase RutF
MNRRDLPLDRLVIALIGRAPWSEPAVGGAGTSVGSPGRTEILLPPSGVDTQAFRAAMGAFPSPVSVVTALDEQGIPRGLTCSAVCSLSMAPPSMLICVNRRNGSLQAIRCSGGFVINLLRADRREVSDLFASSSPAKFATTGWRRSEASGLPVLADGVLATVDCQLQAEIVAGSHVILVGLVRAPASYPATAGPLVYWQRRYGAWVPGGPASTCTRPSSQTTK